MIGPYRSQLLALILCFILLVVTTPLGSGAAVFQSGAVMGSDYSGQGIPYTTDELQTFVAPMALYPDPLVAQVLIAATYPDQIVVANAWLQGHKDLKGTALIEAVDAQPWDPAVKALTLFPGVLEDMARNLVWTSILGEAYHNQPSWVMMAIQTMRAKAKADKDLKSTPQMILAQPSGDIITLNPQNPLLVYVPEYNPALVYGTPVQTPGYSAANAPATGAISFGAGVPIGALTDSDWGWKAWDCNWFHGAADYRNYPYYGNHAWHGGYYGGYIYYGNHTYHNDPDRPPTAHASAQLLGTGGKHTFTVGGVVNPTISAGDAWGRESGGWTSADGPRGWGQSDPEGKLTAFSSWDPQEGSSFGSGWAARAASYRGWTIHGGSTGWGVGNHLAGLHW
ncbi:MAG TPA: DUF3300 domain-containing protein [Terriglobales bacterium]|nr:DUF3300 domain-containing protein [Terriglobales bacterium]